MAKVYAMIADGTEETECLSVVDVLRRAGIDTELVSVGEITIVSSHGVRITADRTVSETDLTAADLIFLPGGMPGAERLAACDKLVCAIGELLKKGKRVAAVCAAPALVLGANGFLIGKKAVCYPSPEFERFMKGVAVLNDARVVTDGYFTTARGLGCCLELGLELVKLLVSEADAAALAQKIQM